MTEVQSRERRVHGTDRPERAFRGMGRLPRLRELALVPALVVLLIIGAIVNDSFLTTGNLISILGASAALALVVLGESLVLISGKFDLSLESTVGIAPAIGALLVIPSGFGTEWHAAAGIATILLVGAVIGAFNGFLIVKLKLNAFIVTLAMLIVLRGLLVGATEGKTLFDMPEAFFTLATATFIGLPISVWLALVLFAVTGFVLRYHRVGRSLYAIGGNREAARAAGINVDRISGLVFVVAGVLAAIGGLVLTGYVGAINANQGDGMIFTVFAAAVIGGISLDGGRGTMFGALTGVLLLAVVENLLTLAQVPSFWIQAVYGAIILVSLMLARFTGGKPQT
ncbi:simple sugar transport system permease protein [Actinophytocola algeriensis]|uniref:Autoinducer 2 import system permease protein LsrC n=2 Tax=Actinophytocola algeriensis TaxID=1768010 RepID=A0A7W7VEY0_9PSEU|nr:simple sugar transport system permease protein [Actinophytocola algeriensis]MBE1479752.1 simple sugar transport system permease protein [Actinophytocola algeriensis]